MKKFRFSDNRSSTGQLTTKVAQYSKLLQKAKRGVVDLTCYHGNHYDITICIKELLNGSVVHKDILSVIIHYNSMKLF